VFKTGRGDVHSGVQEAASQHPIPSREDVGETRTSQGKKIRSRNGPRVEEGRDREVSELHSLVSTHPP
jgi:hypothetical protein